MKKNYFLQKVDYGNTDNIHRNYSGFTNAMVNIPRFQNHYVELKASSSSEGISVELRPYQKNVSRMMEIVGKITNPR